MHFLRPRLKSFYQNLPLQLCQTVAIGSFLLVGGWWLGYIDILWWQAVMVLCVTAATDYFLRVYLDDEQRWPWAGINSGIGICLFLRTDFWPVLLFAALVAIFSKYLIRINGKHFFNPSYTAIFFMVVLFDNKAYINHFQWGSDWFVLLPILAMGLFVVVRAKLWDSVLAFWGTLLLCLALFVDFSLEDFMWLFVAGSFLIMSFHGFTDPATMPNRRPYRLMFSAQIAILFFICRQFINEGYSFFAAYFLVTLAEVGLWRLEGKRWRGYEARLLVQGGLTVGLLLLLGAVSYAHFLETDGIWPRLLTNRCIKLICQWGIDHPWELDD